MEDRKNDMLPIAREVEIASFPETIAKQVGALADLQGKVESAEEMALKARQGADSLDAFVRKKFLGIEYKSGETKEKIEAIQDVVKEIAIAQEENAIATTLSFRFQEAISKTTEYLFALGCVDMAANEAMIEQIKQIRDGNFKGGKINLTEDVKKRILEVAQRLKAHQDILLKMDKLKQDLSNLSDQQTKALDKLKGDIAKNSGEANTAIAGIRSKHAEMSSSVSNLKNSIEQKLTELKQSANKSWDEVNRAIADLSKTTKKSRTELDLAIATLGTRLTETSSSVAEFKSSTDQNISDVRETAAKDKTELDQAIAALGTRLTETSSSVAELKSSTYQNISDVKEVEALDKAELDLAIADLSAKHTEMSSTLADFKSATEQGILALNDAAVRTTSEIEQKMTATYASYKKEIESLKKKNKSLTVASIVTFIFVLLHALFNVILMLV